MDHVVPQPTFRLEGSVPRWLDSLGPWRADGSVLERESWLLAWWVRDATDLAAWVLASG